MQKIEFEVKSEKELIKAIIDELPFLSRFDVKKILENKDVKVNNQRTKENINLKSGDKLVVFYQEKEQKRHNKEMERLAKINPARCMTCKKRTTCSKEYCYGYWHDFNAKI